MNKHPSEIDESIERLNASVMQKLFETSPQLEMTLRSFAQDIRSFFQGLARISQSFAPYIESIILGAKFFERYSKFVDSVGATGWLPYHTVPISYVEECGGNTSLLEQRLSTFYETNWNGIRQDIESRLEAYHIDDEARETFREALSAHEAGLYRCVCRVLFPEIERMIRRLPRPSKNQAETIYSKRKKGMQMHEKLTNCGSLEDFMPREAYGWILFDRLVNHLYEDVEKRNKKKFQQDFVPNRHASAHGLVSYSTHKHSMNMIIMADYIFQVLPSIK